ncbi:MAG: S8 family serine peptidase [Anaerolineae bacterium]|nr:S8 family serine peptidase [Anaerolineae bacterium]
MQRRQRPLRSLLVVLVAGLGALVFGGLTWLALGAAGSPPAGVPAGSQDVLPVLPQPPLAAHVAPEAQRAIAAAPDGSLLRLIVVLRLPSDGAQPAPVSPASDDWMAQRARAVAMRRASYLQAKASLSPVLTEARRAGTLTEERDLWLVNAIGLEVTTSVARALLASPAVAEVHLDRYVQYLEPAPSFAEGGDVGLLAAEIPWGLQAIDAPRVWHTFAVSGTGAVVAVMDTGVDWQHPDLMGAYRGNVDKGVFDHASAWYDAVSGGTYPYDDHGHGTHVAGTAVGASVGVAPGARWIGVKVMNSDGYGYDSWILSGFQWLLAPNGDASLAPDTVNASWSSSDMNSTVFLEAIQTLEAAGIFSAFAAGNSGPQSHTVGSPASNPGVLAVGASDPDRQVASFSSRGPSPWDEIKPLVVAPGVNIVSSGPGGTYLSKSGTSMAAPHVAGLGALMRSVSPTISVATMTRVITETARPLITTLPNNDSGWGEIDAYQAVVALVKPALLVGTVTDNASQGGAARAIPGATITAWPDTTVPGEAPGITTNTDAEGHYTLALTPGRYTVRADAFGYDAQTVSRVDVLAGPSRELNFALAAMPTGRVQGNLTIQGTGAVPTSTVWVRAQETPVAISTTKGTYSLLLPVGDYTLQVRGLGYRVVTATVSIVAGSTAARDFVLERAPALLLIDEGAWYYGSQVSYWTESLDALRYVYDLARIKDPGSDVPVSSTLATYDVVLWSSPFGSPGLVGASSVLSTYLASGGNLLLSGQDVAYLDGGGSLWGAPRPYLAEQMGVQYVADTSATRAITGSGPFAGLQLELWGGTGADNQASPDVVAARDPELAAIPWTYAGGTGAGVAADICVPYRSLLFSFGFESIAAAQHRHSVLQRSIDWLAADPLIAGLTVTSVTASTQIGLPGERVIHVLKVRHIGYAGTEETVTLTASGQTWPTEMSDTVFQLAPCASALVTVTVTIPADVSVNVSDAVVIAATSDNVPLPVSTTVTTKTPASVLLVDDDRWYPMEDAYRDALDAAGIVYDLWDTRSGAGGLVGTTSPSTDTLLHYPIVVWFTGYDWYAPVEEGEVARLQAYLDGGGKLLLSSQDFVYHHQDDPLTTRLGVLLADWAHQAKEARGVTSHPAGQGWVAEQLSYPFPNWSHTIEPLPTATPVVRGQLGQPIGIATGGPGGAGSQTLFYAFPLEALSLPARSRALANGIGWLSPLGASEFLVSPRTAAVGDVVTFELVVRNTGGQPMAGEAVHRVPVAFDVSLPTLPAGLTYDPASREIVWQGTVSPAAPVRFAWDATWLGGVEHQSPTVTLSLPVWDIAFVREAPFYGEGLDLAASQWQSGWETPVRTTEPLTLTYTIYNSSANTAADATLSLWLMTGLGPITATTPLTQGVALTGWRGSLGPFARQDVVIPVQAAVWDRPVRIDALLMTGAGSRWEDHLWLSFEPWRHYLPIVR